MTFDSMTFDTNEPNGWPPNMEPATEMAFWQNVINYGYGEIERRFPLQGRALRKSDPTYPNRPSAVLVHSYEDGTGFVIALIPGAYGKPSPRFFTFALCDHEYVMTKERICYSEHRCRKCGYINAVDSS